MIEVNKENYDTEVIQADMPVIVDFWGPGCAPCITLMPKVADLACKYEDKIKFCKLNTAGNRRLCITLGIMGLPSFLAYKNGEEIKRISGQDLKIEDVEVLARQLLQHNEGNNNESDR